MLFFVAPIIYLVGAPDHYVYSFFGLNQPLLALPYGQSVCVTWTVAYGQIGPGAWIICPLGGLQTLLTTQSAVVYVLPMLLALLIFLLPIFILGNVFCSWICPVGALIDSFDKFISNWLPKIDAKRQQRFEQGKYKLKHSVNDQGRLTVNLLNICPSCFIGKALGHKHVNLANGVLVASLVGSAVLRFPVFCTFCPIGITTRGMFHLKALTSITGTMMPILLEFTFIPLAAVLVSLREKRYWCRKICPVGATLNIAGSVSPLVKPSVNTKQCIAKTMVASSSQRQIGCNRCERVCPQGIILTEGDSLIKCTKCLECYIVCERKAVTLKPSGTPEAVIQLKKVFKRKPKK